MRRVPRPKNAQDLAPVSVNLPASWIAEAEELSKKMSEAAGAPGSLTKSHVFREAIRRGLNSLAAEHGAKTNKSRR